MNPRTKIILFIVVILIIILIFGVGIGVKKGWFAGLADVLPTQGEYPENVVIKVTDTKGNLVNGVDIYITKPQKFEKYSGSVNCNPDGSLKSNSNPIARPMQDEYHRGKTGEDGENGIKRFTVNDAYNRNYIRLSQEIAGFKSCAFIFSSGGVSPGGGTVLPDTDYSPQSVSYFEKIKSDDNQIETITLNYTLRYDTGGTPPTGQLGRLYGKIVDSNNNPIQGASVVVAGAGTRTTDNDGNYDFQSVNPGTYTLEASKECEYNKQTRSGIKIDAGTELLLTPTKLTAGGIPADKVKFTGTVYDFASGAANIPINGAFVGLYLGDSAIKQTTTDSNGSFILCPVNPNIYTIQIYKQNYSEIETEINLTSPLGGVKSQDFTLVLINTNNSFSLNGKVLDGGTNQPLSGASVELLYREGQAPVNSIVSGNPIKVATDSNGKFKMDGVPLPQTGDEYMLKGTKTSYDPGLLYFSLPVNLAAGANIEISPDLILFRQGTLYSISGRVTLQGSSAKPSGINVFLEKSDGTSKKIATTGSDGNYQGTLLSDEIYVPVKICAKYTEGGIENVGCYRDPRTGQNITTLNRHNDNINIIIVVTPTRKVKIEFKDIQGQLVTQPIEFVFGGEVEGQTERTGQTNNGIAEIDIPEQLISGEYFVSAMAPGYIISQSKKYSHTSVPDVIPVTMHSELESEVVYNFHFYQKPPSDSDFMKGLLGSIKQKLGIDGGVDPNFGYPFNKVKLEGPDGVIIDRTQWEFTPNSVNPNFSMPQYLQGKIASITWDETLLSGRANEEGIYRLTVRFINPPDEQTKQKWAKDLFKDIEFTVNTIGTTGITYSKGKVKKISYSGSSVNQEIYDVIVGFNVTAINPELLVAALLKTLDGVTITVGKDNNVLIESDGITYKIKVKQKSKNTPPSESPQSTSSLYEKEMNAVDGLVYLKNIPAGEYEVTSLTRSYPIDTRKNSFTIASGQNQQVVSVGLCYAPNSVIDWSYNGLGYLLLGQYQSRPFQLMQQGLLKSRSLLDKVEISKVVYLGNMAASSVTSTNELTYCLNNQDRTISGKSIVMSDGYLKKATKLTANQMQAADVVSTKIDYEAGLMQFDALTNNQKNSFRRVYGALNQLSEEDQNNIMKYILESSTLGGVDIEVVNDASSNMRSLYSLSLAAYKQDGPLKQRLEMMPDGQAKNVASALVRFSVEMGGANNSSEESLFEPYSGKLSNTIYPVRIILNGSWMKSKYRNASVGTKITLQYSRLLSNIRGSKSVAWINAQIVAFNNWLDRIRGTQDTGKVSGKIIKNGQPVKDVLVTIGGKVARTNGKGEFSIARVPVGRQNINIKDRATGAGLELAKLGQFVWVNKNEEKVIVVRLASD